MRRHPAPQSALRIYKLNLGWRTPGPRATTVHLRRVTADI
nr:MAG TPA: hypothetical protein [Caudoviricetes sp.]